MKPICLFVVGPTASGKSDLAAEIAAAAPPAEIINCDSIQFFSGLDIGSAKPTAETLNRVPHHLVSHLELGAEYTAGDFRRDALKIIERGGVYLPTGGSGFYVQALEKGMYEVPEVAPEIRAQLEKEFADTGAAPLYEEMRQRDPETALKIQPQDRYRILRSLELLRSMPGTLSDRRREFERTRPEPSFVARKIGVTLDRDQLRKRAERRTSEMLRAGLVDEVWRLREAGFKDWAPLSSVGYKETQMFLDGALKLSELPERITTSTMQLAKRQMTWFKRDPEIRWFDTLAQREQALKAAAEILSGALEP